jgi:lipoic acid synthetase
LSGKKPDWLKKKIKLNNKKINEVTTLIKNLHLNTVCQSALCPNIYECFSNKTAIFMILGDICTRNCGFCSIKTGKPVAPDKSEPLRIAEAVREMGLKYVVITSVTRDDLPDGGSNQFVRTIIEI